MSFEPTPQALDLLKKRYFRRDDDGVVTEDWNSMCHRIAHALAEDNHETQAFFDVLNSAQFLPGTPTLVNAGKPDGQFSSCFVLPVGDSIPEIFDSIKHTALVHKSGGGTGFNFSSLRPEGSVVGSTKGVSSGPISFMRIFNAATQEMKQGGVRRGANMGILDVSHPNIVKFIKCKDIDGEMSNFNISVGITDEFMKQLLCGRYVLWSCEFNGESYYIRKSDNAPWNIKDVPDDADDPNTEPVYHVHEIWELIIKQAHKNGEPGLIFLDKLGPDINATNPCGEQGLKNYEACNLGDIDISKFYDERTNDINWNQLQDVIEVAVVFMNRILDKSTFPLPQITEAVQKSRKIGIGVMGWADLLLKRRIRYGSPESITAAEEVMRFIKDEATAYSKENSYDNETITCIAPTGSRCILANCSSGIEPNFAWKIDHKREDFPEVTTYHPLIKIGDRTNDNWEECLPNYWVTANQITPEEHVTMQAAFQEFTDAGVSKTINLSEDATEEDVRKSYELAYEKGCKGVTVYRDGCRKGQVLSRTKKPEKASEPSGEVEDRPYRLDGDTFKLQVDLGGQVENLYVNVTKRDNRPYEVFANGVIRDIEPHAAQTLDIITRLSSLALRYGVPTMSLVKQLEKVNGGHIYSLPHKIANVLREYLNQHEQGGCPECNAKVVFAEGCMKCTSCGWAKCG